MSESDFRELNEWRRLEEHKSEKEYRFALMDYNDALRKAYNKHYDRMDKIEKEWREKLNKIPVPT